MGGNRGVSKDIRDFKIQRRGQQREGKKKKGLISKTTTYHFFVHFFPVFARLGRENALFRVYGGRKQATTKFYFSF